jgi:hypothetical protein
MTRKVSPARYRSKGVRTSGFSNNPIKRVNTPERKPDVTDPRWIATSSPRPASPARADALVQQSGSSLSFDAHIERPIEERYHGQRIRRQATR